MYHEENDEEGDASHEALAKPLIDLADRRTDEDVGAEEEDNDGGEVLNDLEEFGEVESPDRRH